uniref:SHSP domain-containing protein n=1 Tax=Arundo donax TaxID=35708 RepID=A0A0A9ENP7_ARUDO
MSTAMASYTATVGRSPVLPASSVVLARGSWKPTVAFRSSATVKCRRPLTVTCALPEKERPAAFRIPPTALLCPVPPPDRKERWDIKEEANCVRLWFQVPRLSKENIEVKASDDMLEIKSNGGAGIAATDVHGVGAFHIRLLMTKEYDSNTVKAGLKDGMLEVTVPKRSEKDREGEVRVVELGPQSGGGDGAGASKGSSRKNDHGGGTNQGAGGEAGASGKGFSAS